MYLQYWWYLLSDIIYGLLYYIIGYRKKVVRYNLKLSFPEKSSEELLKIEKKSFHHFVDIFMEMIKSFSISNKEIAKRIIIENPELINNYIDWGAGPRASQNLILAAKVNAAIKGKFSPDIEDVKAVAFPILTHRIVKNYKAEAEGISEKEIINSLL